MLMYPRPVRRTLAGQERLNGRRLQGDIMTKRIVLAALAGAVIFWFFGYVWFAATPLGAMTVQPLPAAAQPAVESLKGSGLASGTYFTPHWADPAVTDPEKVAEAMRNGPLVMVHYSAGGTDPFAPMLNGLVHFFVSALLLGLLVSRAGDSLQGFTARWGFIALFGVAAAFYVRLGPAIWYGLPLEGFIWYGVYDVLGWIIAGAAMARILKPADEV
jgi:hypothetical protein